MRKVGSIGDLEKAGSVRVRAQPLEQVLYVEDDDSNWQVAELRLRSGYDLSRAANAAQACQVLSLRGRSLTAILMDIELRGSDLNGIELAELIRGKLDPSKAPPYARHVPILDTPIIFVTAHGAEYSATRLTLAGGQKVLGKPIDFGALSIALTQLHLARMEKRKA